MPIWTSEADRFASFERAVNDLRERTEPTIGPEELTYIRRLDVFSHFNGYVGRGLILVASSALAGAWWPLVLTGGVLMLFLHKLLQATEVGHTALHGAFNRYPNAGKYHSSKFHWKLPIDEASWRRGHNQYHHNNTNIAGRDPDIHFGQFTITKEAFTQKRERRTVPVFLLRTMPHFSFWMNFHFSGLHDLVVGNGIETEFDYITERSDEAWKDARRRAYRKWVPYYLVEFGGMALLALSLELALSAPMGVITTLLGVYAAEVLRDIYVAVTIICGHAGEETASHPLGWEPSCRGEWFVMQVEGSNDFRVPHLVSVLCGALDLQIEHHLFPSFPTRVLRRVAPDVERMCKEHGVAYRRESWPVTIRSAFGFAFRTSGTPVVIESTQIRTA